MAQPLLQHTATTAACVMALCAASPCAWAQAPLDAPATVVKGSCPQESFDLSALTGPLRVDLLVQVDARGRPQSAAPLIALPAALQAAALEAVLKCQYQPALRDGKPASGQARYAYTLDPPESIELKPARGFRFPNDCVPTADDYPEISRRLGETGTTRVRFTLNPEGRLVSYSVIATSGHLRLDFAALVKLVTCKFPPPPSVDGKAASATIDRQYVWSLE